MRKIDELEKRIEKLEQKKNPDKNTIRVYLTDENGITTLDGKVVDTPTGPDVIVISPETIAANS